MCIPIIFGCPTHIKPEGDGGLQLCPRCHNMTVLRARKSTWFELFWVPLVPVSRKHILVCGTCQWNQDIPKGGQAEAMPSGAAQATSTTPNRPGYQPEYIGQTMPKV